MNKDHNDRVCDAPNIRSCDYPDCPCPTIEEHNDDVASGDVISILTARSKTHGSFADNGLISQLTRSYWRTAPNWGRLTPGQQLALDEIALKVARILSTGADPKNPEHWDDIVGYGTLGRNDCDV